MSTSSSSSGGGTSIIGLLGVAFVVLKLTHVIGWSWWLVLLPFYGGLILLLLIGIPLLLLRKRIVRWFDRKF